MCPFEYPKILASLPRNNTIRSELEKGLSKNELSLPLTRFAFKKLGHLPKERILIDGLQLSDEIFEKYIVDAYSLLHDSPDSIPFFRFLTVTALDIFLKEKVDVAIVEVGIGGRFDSTNIVDRPVVAGITSLSLEHRNLLGDTLEQIAHHNLAKQEAKTVQCKHYIVPECQTLSVGVSGKYQRLNASLALAISNYWMKSKKGVHTSKDLCKRSLCSTFIPGRQQIIQHGSTVMFLDVSHTSESLEDSASWFFAKALDPCRKKYLIFYCSRPRDPVELGSFLSVNRFERVFAPLFYEYDDALRFEGFSTAPNVKIVSASEDLYGIMKAMEVEASDVLVCGSFYLVGDVLRHIHKNDSKTSLLR